MIGRIGAEPNAPVAADAATDTVSPFEEDHAEVDA